MMTPQKMMFFPLAMHHKYSTMHVIHDHYLPSTSFMFLFIWEKEEDEEEDFQTISLEDEHWTTEEIPNRPLCIHGTFITT